MASLASVGTALPRHVLTQETAAEVLAAQLPSGEQRLLGVLQNSVVEERRLVCPVAWYLEPRGFQERMQAFLDAAPALAEQAATRALLGAGVGPEDVGAVLSATTTGLATPGIEALLVERLGLRPDVVRLPVWGLGCAAGVAGLARAAETADALGKPVLFLALEACSLAFPGTVASGVQVDKKQLVAASLFGDGCAAAVLMPQGAPPAPEGISARPRLHVRGARSHLFPDSRRVMGWDVHDDRFDVVLSPAIPDLVRAGLGPVVAQCVEEVLDGRRPDHWVLHPGGAKVVEAMSEALGLEEGQVAVTRDVLRRHGNMSSPTVLFVLRQAWDRMQAGDTALLGALGPGFAAELLALEARP